jgi:hypothetical protein
MKVVAVGAPEAAGASAAQRICGSYIRIYGKLVNPMIRGLIATARGARLREFRRIAETSQNRQIRSPAVP